MSYPFAAYLTGALAERGFDRSYRSSVLAMSAGLALIFACGIAWLAWFTRPVPAGLDVALRTGLYPFLPADIVKICLAAGVMPSIWALLGRKSSSAAAAPKTMTGGQEIRNRFGPCPGGAPFRLKVDPLPDLLTSCLVNALVGAAVDIRSPRGSHRAGPDLLTGFRHPAASHFADEILERPRPVRGDDVGERLSSRTS